MSDVTYTDPRYRLFMDIPELDIVEERRLFEQWWNSAEGFSHLSSLDTTDFPFVELKYQQYLDPETNRGWMIWLESAKQKRSLCRSE